LSKRARHKQDDYFHVNKNLLLLLISVFLFVVAFWVALVTAKDCERIEYQDLSGTHYMTVCKEMP